MRLARTVLAALVLLVALTSSAPAHAEDEVVREAITFDDIAGLDELTREHAEVLRLYWVYFDRAPDPLGALYWLDQFEQCQSLQNIARFFEVSEEFRLTYGALDTAEFVDLVYVNALDRLPDGEGRAYWIDLIRRSVIDRSGLMVLFSISPEFRGNHPLPSENVPGRGCRNETVPFDQSPRSYALEPWPAFARVGDLTLLQPSAAVELIGFHESSHDGAQSIDPTGGPTAWVTMDSRNRDTTARGAADIAAHPLMEIRAPVTGTVIRAGGYVLYCRYSDDYAVIEPDDRPGWEVKVLHMRGLQVGRGDRVVAGETVLASGPNQFPFSSQIDELTANPSWPHVHIEVVDPSIPDRPSPGGGC
jgi:hypothetical protein